MAIIFAHTRAHKPTHTHAHSFTPENIQVARLQRHVIFHAQWVIWVLNKAADRQDLSERLTWLQKNVLLIATTACYYLTTKNIPALFNDQSCE